MTTRKHQPLAAALAAAALGLAGCATPGPLHVYLAAPHAPSIRDEDGATTATVPSFLADGDTLTGLAYDPFTDHLFLRLAPGNRIRVVDRPARAIKREFTAEGVPATGGGDLAVRPRDGHLFLSHPTEPAVIELTRFGKFVRTIPLEAASAPADGVAYDAARDRLLVLAGGTPAHVVSYDLTGALLGTIRLAEPVAAGPLGFDSEKREYYLPLPDRQSVGVFDESGKQSRTLPAPAMFLDVGPRSFLRVF